VLGHAGVVPCAADGRARYNGGVRDERVIERVRVAALEVELERPADAEALIDERAFAREDEFLPYWAEPPAGLRVLELGCGLGLPSVVAALLGARVTASDWSADAVAATERNAERNGVAVEGLVASWFAPGPLLERAPWDLVVGADLLYEHRNAAPLLALVPRLAPRAWIADPGRHTAAPLVQAARADPERWRRITP
jgi:2-polyprenyl-3-methyl-5-hydroxy-6-metoxy-1,4-benzoquinol methylase